MAPVDDLIDPTPYPMDSMTYARMREASIEKGLPSCLFVPMAKSGSISVGAILNSGFSLVSMTYGLRVIPSWAREYNKGGACHATHLIGTDENISRLIDAGITKAIVHVRDPRQVILSLVHHKVKYERTFDEVRKYSYVDMPLPEKVDFVFKNNWEKIIEWIELWVEASKRMEITFTTFEDFVTDKDRFIRKVLDAYGGPRDYFDYDAAITQRSGTDYHLRKGLTDEWREAFTPAQYEFANETMPEHFFEMFGWQK